jgi:hypothetical protein
MLVSALVFAASLPSYIKVDKQSAYIEVANKTKPGTKGAQTARITLGVDVQYTAESGHSGRQCIPADFEVPPGAKKKWSAPRGTRILTYSVDYCTERTTDTELW